MSCWSIPGGSLTGRTPEMGLGLPHDWSPPEGAQVCQEPGWGRGGGLRCGHNLGVHHHSKGDQHPVLPSSSGAGDSWVRNQQPWSVPPKESHKYSLHSRCFPLLSHGPNPPSPQDPSDSFAFNRAKTWSQDNYTRRSRASRDPRLKD